MDKNTKKCTGCPVNSINPGNTLGCHNCSMQHYTTHISPSDDGMYANQHCLACETGKIRQATSNFLLCEACPSHYFISPQTQECELCELDASLPCGSVDDVEEMYSDDCSSADNFQDGCTCGCRICSLHVFVGTVKNFMVLPGCRAACDNGYKLQRPLDRDPPFVCTMNHDLFRQEKFAPFNNGQMKFSVRNSDDFTLAPCFQFFALSLSQLSSLLHIEPMPPSHELSLRVIRVNTSILASYITHWWEILDIDETCIFQCISGYTPRASLSSKISECVPLNHALCTTSVVPAFVEVSSCLHRDN